MNLFKFKNLFSKKLKNQGGFTLIEMIVSLGIFMVVAVIAVGALLKVIDANRRSINLKTSINNLNFSLESMSREMRVGSDYYCENSIATNSLPVESSIETGSGYSKRDCSLERGNWVIAFRSSVKIENCDNNLVYAYRYNGKSLQGARQSVCNVPIESDDFQDLTSQNLVMDDSSVSVTNSFSGIGEENKNPEAYFWFKGYTGIKAKDRSEFSMQTSVMQRIK